MQPSQLSLLPVYHLDPDSDPVHFVHVTDVISLEYAKKCELFELYEAMIRLAASCAVRTAESQLAIWVPRPGVDTFSMIDERIPSSQNAANVFLRNNGCFYAIEATLQTRVAAAHAA